MLLLLLLPLKSYIHDPHVNLPFAGVTPETLVRMNGSDYTCFVFWSDLFHSLSLPHGMVDKGHALLNVCITSTSQRQGYKKCSVNVE